MAMEDDNNRGLGSLARKASFLHVRALSLAEGMRSGAFRSLYRGQGIEFSGVREYLYGDDVRAIDWNVTARMGRPYIKVFEEERELDVFLVIDTSLSMLSGSGRQTRLEKALDCASLLTLASVQNNSSVGAVLFDGKIHFSCAPLAGKDHALLLLSHFEKKYEAEEPGSVLDNALLGADRLLKKRSLVMVFSDFRTSGFYAAFGRLCQKHDVVAARISAPLDEKLPPVGAVPFADIESGYRSVFPTSSPAFQRAWVRAHYQRIEIWQRECLRHGGIPLLLSTEKDSFLELSHFFASWELK